MLDGAPGDAGALGDLVGGGSLEADRRNALDHGGEDAPPLDPTLSRKVPMLLEQYLFKTAVPGSLDMRMCTYMYI